MRKYPTSRWRNSFRNTPECPPQVVRNPVNKTYVLTSKSNTQARSLHCITSHGFYLYISYIAVLATNKCTEKHNLSYPGTYLICPARTSNITLSRQYCYYFCSRYDFSPSYYERWTKNIFIYRSRRRVFNLRSFWFIRSDRPVNKSSRP